jgi:hypothetical protein
VSGSLCYLFLCSNGTERGLGSRTPKSLFSLAPNPENCPPIASFPNFLSLPAQNFFLT